VPIRALIQVRLAALSGCDSAADSRPGSVAERKMKESNPMGKLARKTVSQPHHLLRGVVDHICTRPRSLQMSVFTKTHNRDRVDCWSCKMFHLDKDISFTIIRSASF